MSHTLSITQAAPYSSGYFVCNVCWEKGSGPAYHCAHCNFDLHITCAAIEKQQTHFTHFKHPLYLKPSSSDHICDVCGKEVCGWVFRCDLCDYDMHSLCVRAPRFVLHPSHHHVLTLFKTSDLSGKCRCDACGDRADSRVYRCSSCNYDLHQSCATLPRKVIHPKHVEHNLTLLFQPPNGMSFFTCDECKEEGKGWLFHCPLCRYNLHPKCANISHELPHVNVQNFTHERYSSAASTNSVMLNTTPAISVSDADLEATERVLSFARHCITENSSHLRKTCRNLGSSSISLQNADQDICPTCLEGYDLGNPKKITQCGHNFHFACLLEWMERSNHCPVCRKVMVMEDE